MAFAKLDQGIVDSSIWDQPDHIIRLWITFLAKKNHAGKVIMAESGLRRTAHISDDEDGKKFRSALEFLESPDNDSKSKAENGRRVIRIEGGWFVVNHKKYTDFTYSDSPDALRQRRHRDGEKDVCDNRDVSHMSQKGRDISISISKSISVSEELKQRQKEFASEVDMFKDTWDERMLKEFYDYWTEPHKKKPVLRWELETTWDMGRRLSMWARKPWNEEKNYKHPRQKNGN